MDGRRRIMTDWEAVGWRFSNKGDRIVGHCGHVHRKESAAKECASKLNSQSPDLNHIWVAREIVYV